MTEKIFIQFSDKKNMKNAEQSRILEQSNVSLLY